MALYDLCVPDQDSLCLFNKTIMKKNDAPGDAFFSSDVVVDDSN